MVKNFVHFTLMPCSPCRLRSCTAAAERRLLIGMWREKCEFLLSGPPNVTFGNQLEHVC